ESLPTRGTHECALRIITQHMAVKYAGGSVVRNEIDEPAIENYPVVSLRGNPADVGCIKRAPADRVRECSLGIIPQNDAVAVVRIGREKYEPAIEDRSFENGGDQARGVPGVMRLPTGGVREARVRVITEHAAAAVGLNSVDHRDKIDVTPVKDSTGISLR